MGLTTSKKHCGRDAATQTNVVLKAWLKKVQLESCGPKLQRHGVLCLKDLEAYTGASEIVERLGLSTSQAVALKREMDNLRDAFPFEPIDVMADRRMPWVHSKGIRLCTIIPREMAGKYVDVVDYVSETTYVGVIHTERTLRSCIGRKEIESEYPEGARFVSSKHCTISVTERWSSTTGWRKEQISVTNHSKVSPTSVFVLIYCTETGNTLLSKRIAPNETWSMRLMDGQNSVLAAIRTGPVVYSLQSTNRLYNTRRPTTLKLDRPNSRRVEEIHSVEKFFLQQGFINASRDHFLRTIHRSNHQQKDVFICHVRLSGGDQALHIASTLENRSILVCLNQQDGEKLERGNFVGIENSSVFLLFLTKDIFSHPRCLAEIERARELKKPILLCHECDESREPFQFLPTCLEGVSPKWHACVETILKSQQSCAYERKEHEAREFFDHLVKNIRSHIRPVTLTWGEDEKTLI